MTTIRGTTRLAAVLGWPVEHSRSPQLLNAAFEAAGLDTVLVPIGVPPEELELAVRGLAAARAVGASVTLPHKVAVASLCDDVRPEARAIGAVNCLHFEGTHLVGHNTDSGGFLDALLEAGFDPARAAHVVLLGGGGAARAVAYALRDVPVIEVIARRPLDWAQHGVTARPWHADPLRASFERADLVVDCTPIGLGSPDEATLVDALPLDALEPHAWVSTLVYHRPTILLERARRRGHSTLDGRAMLVHQGARAFTIWTGRIAPLAAMRQALADALAPGP